MVASVCGRAEPLELCRGISAMFNTQSAREFPIQVARRGH